jgi:ADP-heptose:LPS heptosyltransferase
MLWLSGARRRVGWACGGGGFLLTESPDFVLDRPEAQSRLALLNTLGIRTATGEDVRLPRFPLADDARNGVDRWLAEQFPAGPPCDRLFVVHVGSGMPAKRWPAEHWRELIRHLAAAPDAQVVLVGSEADRIIAARILAGRPWENVADATGRLRIVELAALADRACVFVGADSGPAHLAAAVGTPVVVLFSGTNSSRQWRPAGQWVRVVRHAVPCGPCHRHICPLAQHPCMHDIRPAVVLQAVRDLLGRYEQSHAQSTPSPNQGRKGVRDDCPAASG